MTDERVLAMSKDENKVKKVDHAGHRRRMRERFLSEGLSSFQPHNVLEMLLFFSIPRADTNEIAHKLLMEFGSLSGVFDAPLESLKNVEGIGEHSAILIKMIPELCRRYLEDSAAHIQSISSSEESAAYFIPKFVGHTSELFYILCLDNRGNIKKCSLISEGGLNYTDANTRKIMQEVIATNATALILAHNHPHGLAVPSKADGIITKQLSELLAGIDVRLTDHIIISGKDYFSMAENPKYSSCFSSYRILKKVSDNDF